MTDIINYLGKWHRRLYKTRYYAKYAYLNFLPYKMIAKSLDDIICEYINLPKQTQRHVQKRVDYYNKINTKQTISQNLAFVGKFKNNHASAYYYDIAQWLRYFPQNTPFAYLLAMLQPFLMSQRF